MGAAQRCRGVNVVLLRLANGFLTGATAEDSAKLSAWKPGEAVRVKFAGKPRNYRHFGKFMACVSFVAERHPVFRRYQHTEPLLHFLKDETGHYFVMTKPNGDVIKVPKSISFDAMDEGEFIAWSREAKKVLAELLSQLPASDQEAAGWIEWCIS